MTEPATYPKRLIEVDLPIKRISEHARREKSIRHGHISTLHIWWARRPLGACRAVLCAALWIDPADPLCPESFREVARVQMRRWVTNHISLVGSESYDRFVVIQKTPALLADNEILRRAMLDFIADFANWDNSTNEAYLNLSRALTQAAHEALGGGSGTKPTVADPFAGGGAIPLEALRIGADTFASDLNAVPVLLNKVLVEYIPRYGQQLADEVRKWGEWVKKQAENELSNFYQSDADGEIPIAYLWARTILSEAPGQNDVPVEVPLLRSMLVAKRKDGDFVLRWGRDDKNQVKTILVEKIYDDGTTRLVRQPLLEIYKQKPSLSIDKATSKGGSATCPITGFTTSVENVRSQLIPRVGGSSDARLLCVVTSKPDGSGRSYRLATTNDLHTVQKAAQELECRKRQHRDSIPLVPDGKLNHLRGFFNVILYGMTTWGDLFAPRQNLALTTLTRLVDSITQHFQGSGALRIAIQSVLALVVDRVAAQSSTLSWWQPKGEFCVGAFGRQALPMVWDFCEINPLAGASGNFDGALDWVVRVIEAESKANYSAGNSAQFSATSNHLPDDSVDATITDPPYYSAIPYADLSDFFYSWLTRSLGNVHPDLFKHDQSPKDDECVSLSHRAAMYRHKDSKWFEEMMHQACSQSRRVTKPSGIGVFVFANKETSGWEAMLTALISAGWTVTASWPIDTERAVRMRAQNSAALGSSVHLVCRPRENSDGSVQNSIGDWRDVLRELPIRIREWMPRLTKDGVVGADAIFACLGPALEIFSRYSSVEKANGDRVNLKEYLEHTWAAVSKEAFNSIFEGADATGFEEDARLTAIWFWVMKEAANGNGSNISSLELDDAGDDAEDIEKPAAADGDKKPQGYTMEYDAIRKLAQGLGVNLHNLSQPNGIITIKGNTAILNSVVNRAAYLLGRQLSFFENQVEKRDRKRQERLPVAQLKAVKQRQGHIYDPQPKLKFAPVDQLLFPELNQEDTRNLLERLLENGSTMLDRLHQSMLLFAHSHSTLLRSLLMETRFASDPQFWRLAQALLSLYPNGSDEKRWVEGVLSRKKSLGF